MSAPATKWKYLERDPHSACRQLSIKGRRIKARTLYGRFVSAEDPRTVDQIAADCDLPVEAVRDAIEYCQSNPPEVEEDQRVEEAIMEASGMNDPGYKVHGQPAMLSPQELARIEREVRGQ